MKRLAAAAATALAAALALAGAGYAVASRGPWSFRAAFRRDARERLARLGPEAGPPVTEADLATLPAPVARYLRLAGAVGQPRVRALRARFRGALRSGPDDAWMPMTADQVSTFDDAAPARLFHITASRAGVPFEAYHRMIGPSAAFTVKLLSAVRIVDARGPEMDRSEAVTFLNDMALLAPSTLLSPRIRWEPVDDRTARAIYTSGPNVVRAELRFDGEGRLADFVSDDRMQASRDGKSFRAARWSTPVEGYRAFGPARLMAGGEARWHLPEGAFAYARLELVDVAYDPRDGWAVPRREAPAPSDSAAPRSE